MRPIDADALKKDLHPDGKPFHPTSLGGLLVKYIDNAQTLDVTPVVHGEWIIIGISVNGSSTAKCSKCGAIVHDSFTNTPNYCPNCGAKMKEGENR